VSARLDPMPGWSLALPGGLDQPHYSDYEV
jgi:hypothetical protein